MTSLSALQASNQLHQAQSCIHFSASLSSAQYADQPIGQGVVERFQPAGDWAFAPLCHHFIMQTQMACLACGHHATLQAEVGVALFLVDMTQGRNELPPAAARSRNS